MKTKNTHKEILRFIEVIRDSFQDASIVYKWGGCYGFYKVLKHSFPKAISYFTDKDKDHIISKIGGRFYDIDGEYDSDYYDFNPKEAIKLTVRHHEIWGAKHSSQRVEFMLAKYNRMIKRHPEIK